MVGIIWCYYPNQQDRKLESITYQAALYNCALNASNYHFVSAPEGALTQITDAYNNQVFTLTPDNDDRLTSMISSAGPAYSYGYDPADNLGSISTPTRSVMVTPNALNQMSSYNTRSVFYDKAGHILQDYAGRTYGWDAENRLLAIGYPDGSQSDFAYDGLGRRVAITYTSGGVTTGMHYGWCGSMLCQARDLTDNPVRRYLPEGEYTPSQIENHYYAVDQLGSVRDVLDATSGASAAHYDYEPYGAPTASATDFRYAGLFFHQTSGLMLGTYRAYDPIAGRWLSRDPLGEAAGYNLYGYVGGTPTIRVDPLGLWTYAIGLSFSIGFGHYSIGGSFGVIVDGHGNIGYFAGGSGGAFGGVGGVAAVAGFSAAASNAPTIADLGGLGGQGSVSVALGGIGVSADVPGSVASTGQPFVSVGGTVGIGFGSGVSGVWSYTSVFGPSNIPSLPSSGQETACGR